MSRVRRPAAQPHVGHMSPSGQLWQVPRYPRPQVRVFSDRVEIDGNTHPVGEDEQPYEVATAELVRIAQQLRGANGAIHADVRGEDSEQVWQAIITGSGDVFDATPAVDTAGGMSRRRRRALLASGGAAVAVLVLMVVAVLASQQSPPPPVAAAPPPPRGVPTQFPALPPPGFAGRADWSAPIADQTAPLITADGIVVTLDPSTSSTTVSGRDPETGVPAWSVPLPRGVQTSTAGGLHLSLISGREAVVARTQENLLWFPVTGDRSVHTVPLPPQATLSWAGSTPLITVPGQHAALVDHDRLNDYAVPAGTVALGGIGDTVVAGNSVGQLWRLKPAAAELPAQPTAVLKPPVAGAVALESLAGYASVFPAAGQHPDLLVTTWYSPDPSNRVVALFDATSGSPVGSALTVAAATLNEAGWNTSPHHSLGVLGAVLVDVSHAEVHALPTGWKPRHLSDTGAYGTQNQQQVAASPDGTLTDTGSGVIPIGMAGPRAVVTSTVGSVTTVYGLPPARVVAVPTPSMTVPAPVPLPPTNPVPSAAPSPTPPPPPPAPPAPPAPAPAPAAEPAAPGAPR